MKITTLTLAIASITGAGQVYSASSEDRLTGMEKRVHYLEQRVKSQDNVINQVQSNSRRWIENIEIAGVVEVEAGMTSSEGGADESDITVATVELAMKGNINDWTQARVVLLYEDSGETALDVDSAIITIVNPNSNWSFTTGHTAIPFGVFESHVISDPLTLEMTETFENIIMLSVAENGFGAGAYIFNGDIDETDNDVKSFGAYVSYAAEFDNSAFAVSLGYLNNMGDTDGISAAISDNGGNLTRHVAAMYGAISYSLGSLDVIAEYVGATDDFAANELTTTSAIASPSATHIELAYNFNLSGKNATLAMSFQGTDEAEDIGLPENKTLLGLSVGIMKNTLLAFEISNEEDYAGTETDVITAQLAVGF